MLLVTGAAGFIGSHVAIDALGKGERVRVVDDFSTGFRVNLERVRAAGEVEAIEGDLRDVEVAQKAVAGVEAIVHLAAIPSVARSVADPFASHEANATATLALLEAAREAGAQRIVYAGSSSAYGDVPSESDVPRPKREDMPERPLSPYAASKLAGENYMRAYAGVHGMGTVVLRFFNVFGPRQNPWSPYGAAIPRFAAALLRGERPLIFGDGLQSRDFTYVANVVDACRKAREIDVERVRGQVFNVGCGENVSLLDLVRVLGDVIGVEATPRHEAPRPGDVRHSLADLTRAREALGYEPAIDLAEGLARTVEWMKTDEAWQRAVRRERP